MDDWVAVILEEYKSLRSESLQAIEQMQRTLQIGLVAIGVITGIGVDNADASAAVQVGIAASTPALAATVLVLWLDQLRRSVYAGAHCALIEYRLGKHFRHRERPLTWETQIQTEYDKGGRYRYHRHWATFAALFAASTPMVVTSIVRLGRGDDWVAVGVLSFVFVGLVAGAGLYQAYVHGDVSKKHAETRVAIGLQKPETASDA
jgi:hypothetical protein